MSFTAEMIIDGIDGTISYALDTYQDSASINDAFFGDLYGLNVDEDTAYILQNYTINNTAFWDAQAETEPKNHVVEALKDIGYGLTANALKAGEGLSAHIVTEVKAVLTETVSIEQALITYLDGIPVKLYVDKVTATIVRTETVLSETTHISIGKYMIG